MLRLTIVGGANSHHGLPATGTVKLDPVLAKQLLRPKLGKQPVVKRAGLFHIANTYRDVANHVLLPFVTVFCVVSAPRLGKRIPAAKLAL